MGFWDYFWGTLRDYHGDPFPRALLRTREKRSPHDFETQKPAGSSLGICLRLLGGSWLTVSYKWSYK